MKTPLVYYGGKSRMIPKIEKMIPDHLTYTETYVGGGALFWHKEPAKNEVINDINGDVVNFYIQTKRNFRSLNKLVQESLVSRSQIRIANRMLKGTVKSTDVERAWALWYSFNLTYANKLGAGLKSSVHPNTHIPTLMKNKKLIWTEQLAKRIENTNIEAKPAIEVLKSYNEEYVFHFIDPPYLNADQGHYKGFTEDDFVELLEVVKTLKGTFMLTNYPSVVLKDYRDSNAWYLKSFGFNNKVNSKHEKRKGKTEWVITNYNPDTQKGQLGIKY